MLLFHPDIFHTYHLQISQRDALRVRGTREFDPQYAKWERFEAALRASFGERIARAQAVRKWDRHPKGPGTQRGCGQRGGRQIREERGHR